MMEKKEEPMCVCVWGGGGEMRIEGREGEDVKLPK